MVIKDVLDKCLETTKVEIHFPYSIYAGRLDDSDFISQVDDIDDFKVQSLEVKGSHLIIYAY